MSEINKLSESYCVGGRHKVKMLILQVTEKINPRTKKRIKIIKSTCAICNRRKSQIFTM